jgi:hypothetical protein
MSLTITLLLLLECKAKNKTAFKVYFDEFESIIEIKEFPPKIKAVFALVDTFPKSTKPFIKSKGKRLTKVILWFLLNEYF